jgi:Uma2 family endonuclease
MRPVGALTLGYSRAKTVTMSATTLIQAEQFAQMKFAENEKYELLEGELIPVPSGTPRHCIIRDLLGDLVRDYLRRNPAGKAICELDCRISDLTVRMPDLCIFLGVRVQEMNLDRVPVPFAPDIAVEVLSPSESAMDMHRKVLDYFSAGSQEVWVLDHSTGELFVHSHSGIRVLRGSEILESPLLPGFTVAVVDLLWQ